MAIDRARAFDGGAVRVLTKAEAIRQARSVGAYVLEGRATVAKYLPGESEPYEVVQSEPNLFLTAGIENLWKLATGQTATAWDSNNAYLAVGSSNTAASAGQTALQSQLTGGRQKVDSSGGIVVSGNSVTFKATFSTANANGNWREVGLVNASSNGVFLNRLVQDFGTKTSSAQWVLSLALSIQ